MKSQYAPEKADDPPIVYASGIVACSVCAPNTLDIEELTAIVNRIHPAGTTHGWRKDAAPTFKGGEANPCPCSEYPDARRHYLFEC